jgi:hypothetical protein
MSEIQVRAVKALESIARSLEKIANPVYTTSGKIELEDLLREVKPKP